MPSTSELLDFPLYDLQDYPAAGAGRLEFFMHPVGAKGKTISDTNLYFPGALPSSVEFIVDAIELLVIGLSDADARCLLSRGSFEFHLLQKTYLQLPLEAFELRERWRLTLAIGLRPQILFGASLSWPAPPEFWQRAPRQRIGVMLHGVRLRPMQ